MQDAIIRKCFETQIVQIKQKCLPCEISFYLTGVKNNIFYFSNFALQKKKVYGIGYKV